MVVRKIWLLSPVLLLFLTGSCKTTKQQSDRSPGDKSKEALERIASLAKSDNANEYTVDEAKVIWLSVDETQLDEESKKEYHYLKKKLFTDNFTQEKTGLTDPNISVLHIDGDDLWIGTWSGGIARFSLSAGVSNVYREDRKSLVPLVVNAITPTPTALWFSSYTGISRYNKARSEWTPYQPFDITPITGDIIVRPDGMYIGTQGDGLWFVSNEGNGERIGKDRFGGIINILEWSDRQGVMVGTQDAGVFFINEEGIHSLFDLLPGFRSKNVSILNDDGANLWIGTKGDGIFAWNYANEKLRHYTVETGHIRDNWIISHTTGEGHLFFGTLDGGVSVHNTKTGEWEVLSVEDGIQTNSVSAMAYFRGTLYCGSLGSGLIAIDWRAFD